ncbi:MAG: S8 family serine peptidase [Calditrichaeota bacterium]|nr:S8 family serine peptidase [Calditrichota bacterium]
MKHFQMFLIAFILIFSLHLQALDYVKNRLLIKITRNELAQINPRQFNSGQTGIAGIDSLSKQFGAVNVRRLFPFFRNKGTPERPVTLDAWFVLSFKESQDIPAVAQIYRKLSEIDHAEPSYLMPVDKTPDDPGVGTQWHIEQSNDHDIDAYSAWDIATGSVNIVVGVMDTGVRYFHKDLGGANASYTYPENSRGNMWINQTELNGTSNVDDDGNGKIDDWIGWDFVTGGPNVFDTGDDYYQEDNDPRDFNGHGTHCAGNVSAINNNGVGVCSAAGGWGESGGVGNGVKIMALRIGWDDFPSGYVSLEFAASAFTYAADNGAKIASCSWGSSYLLSLSNAINYFLFNTTDSLTPADRVRLIFKSAGNDNVETADYMANRPDIIAVAASDENDLKASFSNYGTWVDISAPGNNIYSTYHDSNNPSTDAYATISGTSMATPIAASVTALIWSHNPNLTAPEVAQMLFDSADDIDALNPSYTGKLGAGRVNAYTAAQMSDQSLPVTLTAFQVSQASNVALLSWRTESEIDNLGFNILRSNSANDDFRTIASFLSDSTLRGLGTSSAGKEYRFIDKTVKAGNTYYYLLEDVSINGSKTKHGPVRIKIEKYLPETFYLSQNYPNPFNGQTRFEIGVPKKQSSVKTKIVIYDARGKMVKTLFDGFLEGGIHRFQWDGTSRFNRSASSGVYFYGVQSESFSLFKKLLLLR